MTAGGLARERFAAVMARDPIPLDLAALAIAAEEYPHLDEAAYLARLDALAARVVARSPAPARAASLLRALREVLAGEEGMHGGPADYDDPRSSFLNEVLDRRVGLPITLSVVYMEVGRRAGVSLDGVGMPGHFLVRYLSPSGAEIFVDAFHGGEMLSADDCLSRYRERTGRDLDRRLLGPSTPGQIVLRMLGNLRRLYAARKDDLRAWWVLDRILLAAPSQLAALRDRGLAAARLGAGRSAARDLETYLARAPDAQDSDSVRATLAQLHDGPELAN
ncbi:MULTISPECIES: SirB1 family protein [unclassified Anaeromyxobacter]|uniref:SirB1 family protein n=1 Tax=unclassified Anaeromyxobacter TaxID=2620896 RepID=UPI001F56FB5F|nr:MULTISPECIES: transglutaminase-like domain-containing protein [unclassified Anaeromyxobacter]